MSEVKTMKRVPLQFDFERRWVSEVYPRFFDTPKLQEALSDLLNGYEDMLEGLAESMDGFHVVGDTEAEIDIMRLKARTRCRQLPWLKKMFCNYEVEEFILAIAEVLYPNLKFYIQQCDYGGFEPDSVVTDEERTVVFDLKHHHELSAMGSLAMAGDLRAQKDREAMREMADLIVARGTFTEDVHRRVMAELEEEKTRGRVMPFSEKSAP